MRSTISQCRQQSWKHYFKPNIMFSSRKTPVARPRWQYFALCNHLLFIQIPQDLFLHLIPLQGDCNIYHIFIIIYIPIDIFLHLISLEGDGNSEKDTCSQSKMATALGHVVDQDRIPGNPQGNLKLNLI